METVVSTVTDINGGGGGGEMLFFLGGGVSNRHGLTPILENNKFRIKNKILLCN